MRGFFSIKRGITFIVSIIVRLYKMVFTKSRAMMVFGGFVFLGDGGCFIIFCLFGLLGFRVRYVLIVLDTVFIVGSVLLGLDIDSGIFRIKRLYRSV